MSSTKFKGKKQIKSDDKLPITGQKRTKNLINKSFKKPSKISKNNNKGNVSKSTKIERELIAVGSKKDKINALTLMITKNPNKSEAELHNLIEMCKNERHDVAFYILKNIKDLLLDCLDLKNKLHLKRKIISLFEVFLKDIYIKHKVIKLIYEILDSGKYTIEFMYIFVNKIGDKQGVRKVLIECLSKLYRKSEFRKPIDSALEELYFRDAKARKPIVSFVNTVFTYCEYSSLQKIFYDVLNPNDYNDKTVYEKTLENIVNGFMKCSNINELRSINKEPILKIYDSHYLNLSIFKFLNLLECDEVYAYAAKFLISRSLNEFKDLTEVLNTISCIIVKKKDLVEKHKILEILLSVATYFGINFTVSALLLVDQFYSDGLTIPNIIFYLVSSYVQHYDGVVIRIADNFMNRKGNHYFDPYNKIELEKQRKYQFKLK
ncbi:hypothetical protein EDEG_02207, partial [Edhazardia aedis USNM 41457]